MSASTAPDALAPHLAEVSRLSRWAALVLGGGLLPLLAWLVYAPLTAAVVAPAYVKVDLDRRPVQHSEGGIVREVFVRDGQRVAQGEPLLTLGDVAVDADVNRLAYRVNAERASIARLESEQALARAIAVPGELLAAAASDSRLAEQLAKERALFAARRDALQGQIALLREQRERMAQVVLALRSQIGHGEESERLQRRDLETQRGLLKDGFISGTRITQLEAALADYAAKLAEKRSDLARAEQHAVDAELRIKTLEGEYRQQASDQLKVTSARLSEIEQELRKSTDASARQTIVAPVAGEVMNLKFTAPGAVIPPRETIADIVPSDPRLVTEARVRTEDINQVHRGQAAEIRFSAFKYRTTKLVHARVFYIAADRQVDRQTNAAYYVALVEADPASLADAGDLKLQAGMPAEVYFTGEQRTALQYLTAPISETIRRAARER